MRTPTKDDLVHMLTEMTRARDEYEGDIERLRKLRRRMLLSRALLGYLAVVMFGTYAFALYEAVYVTNASVRTIALSAFCVVVWACIAVTNFWRVSDE